MLRFISANAVLAAIMIAPVASVAICEEKPLTDEQKVEKFTSLLQGKNLVGKFTVIGKEGPLKDESYNISKVQKLDEGDIWLIHSRIRYGDKDVTIPVPVEVKWAGDTPVISLTNITIPGMGTFSSRVVLYNGKYAGTWTHGKVGGHLFGAIEAPSDETPEE
jgi:hypothetical protein